MKHIIISMVFVLLCSCSTINKKELLEKESLQEISNFKKLFDIQNLDGWEEYYYHGALNYSPKELSKNNHSSFRNRVGAYVVDSDLSLRDYIKTKNNHPSLDRYAYYNVTQKIVNTTEGVCYVEKIESKLIGKKHKKLVNTYKYNGKIYMIFYSTELENYETYLDEALAIMSSFHIIKN